jgi:luciferase family oxidoreductase group 1
MMPFSVLDLCPVPEGATPGEALRRSLDLVRLAERLGFVRFWVAEHHNMPGIASAATAVVIGHLAAGTKNIRVGSGGVMLPNHAPLVIAEQFGTLASLFPGRIELGLGRAPGTDQMTARALRRDLHSTSEHFPDDVRELQHYFAPVQPGQTIRAVPGAGLQVPIWLLGSSLFSAQLAASLGLPFAFASHFAPELLRPALAIYRSAFEPSAHLQQPYAIAGVNVFAADSDAEAQRQFTSHQQSFLNLRRGRPGQIPAPVNDIGDLASPAEMAMMDHSLACTAVGSASTVEAELRRFAEEVRPNELMVTGLFYDHAARLRSLEITAEIAPRIPAAWPEIAAPVLG